MKKIPFKKLPSITLALLSLCASAAMATSEEPTKVKPLKPGQSVPGTTVYKADGEAVRLSEAIKGTRAVIVFYRGGWCPYCNTHLASLGAMEEELNAAGYQIFAISPDSVAKVAEASEGAEFSYTLLSDASSKAARAFGLAFKVDDATHSMLLDYGIDLEKASGESHRELPVPAVFLVGEKGIIQFRHHDPDYRKRLSADALRAAIGK
jgi:peroxiredoxin